MSELCFSTSPKSQFSTFLLSNLILFFSFIFSHPLYFCYFIFFSPYLLKLLSFLSPLFITTSLLLLALITFSPKFIPTPGFSEPGSGFLYSAYHTILVSLRSNNENEGEFYNPEEFEVYKIVFDTSAYELRGNSTEKLKETSFSQAQVVVEEKTVEEVAQMEAIHVSVIGEHKLESFFKELDSFENMGCNVEEKKIEPTLVDSLSHKVVEEKKVEKTGSEANIIKESDNTVKVINEYSLKTLDVNVNGSMRKEKEWKRTLACKLFEERHNVDGDEGMDSLWEAYEMKGENKKNNKKGGIGYFDDNDDYEEDEEEETNAQLCCLQALKFSAGKMNLGMGKPNLVKISKALKGFGWLHNVSKHGKKRVPVR